MTTQKLNMTPQKRNRAAENVDEDHQANRTTHKKYDPAKTK